MPTAATDVTLNIDPALLATFVGRATGQGALTLGAWHAALLHGGATTNARVYRLHGQATTATGAPQPWSLVLKEWTPRTPEEDVTTPNYWKREAYAYQAPWLQTPSGLRPARCLGVHEPTPTTLWLALEDLAAAQPHPWQTGHFLRAAQHLGQFNGHFAVRSWPAAPWLSHHWLQRWVAICEEAVLALPQYMQHPLVQAHISAATVAALHQLWGARHSLLAALDALPQTLNHGDAFARNLLLPADPATTVAIDWATVGVGAVGEDLAALIGGSLVFFELDSAAAETTSAQALAQYVAGLRQSGWAGDPAQVQLAYTAALALRYGLGSALDVALVADEASHAWAEQVLGHTIAELITNTAQNLAFFLACARTAQTLSSRAIP